MRTIFTFPGKIGDSFLQWPVAYHWAKDNKALFDVWLDENTLKPIERLISSQPCVENVILRPGVNTWTMGGQPYDFGIPNSEYVGNQIFHLGMRVFPQRQITLQTRLDMPQKLSVSTEDFANDPSIYARDPIFGNRCVLHGSFLHRHGGCVPSFWKFLRNVIGDLEGIFDEIVFVGTEHERKRALEIYPSCKEFDDGGDFNELARLIAGSRLVIGAGSSVVALSGAMKIPTIRVHDAIGNLPKFIWSNLGDNQVNDTERELRKSWKPFKEKWVSTKLVTTV